MRKLHEQLLTMGHGWKAAPGSCMGAGEPDQAGDPGERVSIGELLSCERRLRECDSHLAAPFQRFRTVLQAMRQSRVRATGWGRCRGTLSWHLTDSPAVVN